MPPRKPKSPDLTAKGEALQHLVEAQPNPELMATASEEAVRGSLEPLMHQLLHVLSDLTGSKARLRQRLRIIQGEERPFSRWSGLVLSPFFLPVVLGLALVLIFCAPRLLAGSNVTCWMIGGQWMQEQPRMRGMRDLRE